MFYFPKCPDRSWGQTVLYHGLWEFLLSRVQRPGHEPKHFSSFSAEVNNVCVCVWSYNSTTSLALIILKLIIIDNCICACIVRILFN
jgi:hypothetical protein